MVARDDAQRVSAEQHLHALGMSLPTPPEPFGMYAETVQAGSLLIDAARATFAEHLEGGDRRPHVAIEPAIFGERSGAIGAALAARHGGLS